MSRVTLPFLLWFASSLATSLSLHALETSELSAQGFRVQIWQTEDGLPQNAVTSLAQTREGYLWVGTYGGLARFDGVRFVTYDPATTPDLTDRVVVSLFEDDTGKLWIGHGSGALTLHAHGTFSAQRGSNEPNQEGIRSIGTDLHGKLWVLRDDGALEAVHTAERIASASQKTTPSVISWARTVGGRIWLLIDGAIYEKVDAGLRSVVLPPDAANPFVGGIAPAAEGGLWVVQNNEIRRFSHGAWTESRGKVPWSNDSVTCLAELRNGTLAVGTLASGLFLIGRNGSDRIRFDHTNGLPQDWVRCLMEDREGNLWLGAGSGGLVCIRPTAISRFDPPDLWMGRSVLSVIEDRSGSMWFGTEGAGVYRWTQGQWKNFGPREGLVNPYIWSLAEDGRQRLWAGSWSGGPLVLDDGRFVNRDLSGNVQGPIQALWADEKSGEVYAGTRNGLIRFSDLDPLWLVQTRGAYTQSISAIARDKAGALWLGMSKEGLGKWQEGKLSRFSAADGIKGDVFCLHADDDGSLWVGTSNGILRLKENRVSALTPKNGLISNSIGHILDDGLGYFWLSSNRGLQRLAKEHLRACADGLITSMPSRTFDRQDGLPTIELTSGLQAAACRSADGRLWFTSSKGVIVVNPALLPPPASAAPVLIEEVRIDGILADVHAGRLSTPLKPSHQRLEFRYTAPSFTAPAKLHFRYRLEGLDSAWVDSASSRSAFYSQLSAGSYRFLVQAALEDGAWNESASLAFVVSPFIWQAPWFIGLVSLLAVTVAVGTTRALTRRRLQRRIKAMEQRHALVQERARIAQDIHDDVGASLSKIAMLSQPTEEEIRRPTEISSTFANIYATAKDVTSSLDEIVWAVDPSHDSLDSLVDYMGRFAQSFLASARLRCRLDLPVQVPSWPVHAETRHHLFLAFKEVLNNAVRHAKATEVAVSIRLEEGLFTLTVTDNGTGMRSSADEPSSTTRWSGGHGFRNLQARMKRIRGHSITHSSPDCGTKIVLSLPLPPSSTVDEAK